MKKHSKIWVLFRHPLRTFITWIIVMLIFVIVLDFLGINSCTENEFIMILLVTLFIALCITQRHYNKEASIPIQQQQPKRKKRGLLGIMLSANRAYDRKQKSIEDALMGAMMGSFSSNNREAEARHREAMRKADADARARYDAINNMKKAEYDARDAALRGKDKAAYQYQNRADYWYKQSKR